MLSPVLALSSFFWVIVRGHFPSEGLLLPAPTGAADYPPAKTPMIKVLVVDDQKLVRAGFRVILNAESDITVLGEASDGVEALSRTATYSRTWS